MEASTNKADQALSDFLGGDMEYANKAEFNAMASELGVSAGDKIDESQAGKYLASNIGDGKGVLTDDEAKAMGYESAQAMKEAFVEEFNSTSGSWEDIEIQDNLLSSVADDMSLKTAQSLENTIKELNFGPTGEKAGEDFINGLNSMLKGVNIEDQQAAMDALMNIDWSSWDALDQADRVLQEFGGDIDLTSKEWKKFADEMRIASGATPDFSTLKADLNEVSAILNNLDFGKVIKEEDYQRLIAYNNEWERFFILQADGSRQFIGNSQDMQSEIQNNIRQQREELIARKKVQEEFVKANWGHEDDTGNRVPADWENKSGTDTETAQSLLNASGATEDMLKTLGYSDEIIQDLITKATSGQEDLVEEGTTRLREMYQRIGEFQNENLDEADAQLDEMLASTAQNLSDLLALKDEISDEAYDKQLTVLAQQAQSLEELQRIRASGIDGNTGLDTTEYGDALVKMSEQYDNCAKAVEDYSKALLTGDSAQIQAAQSAMELEIEIGELSKKYNLDAKEVSSYANRLKEEFKAAGMSEEQAAIAANKAAIANTRLDRGLLNLNKNLKDYKKSLASSNKGTAEWSKTMDALKNDLSDILGVDMLTLSDDFAETALNSEDLKKALDGDVEAIERLQSAAADEMIKTIKVNLEGEDLASFEAQWEYLKANMADAIESPGIDQSNLIASFNEMIAAGNMTKEQIETALAGLHVSANVKTTYIPQTVEVPQTITEEAVVSNGEATVQVPGENGKWENQKVNLIKKITRTYDAGVTSVNGVVPKYEIEGTEGKGGVTTAFAPAPPSRPSKSSTTSGGAGGGKKGGGGGKAPEHKRKEKVDKFEADPFHKVNQELEDVEHNLKMINKQQSHMFGKELINNLKQQNAQLKKQTELHREKLTIAQQEANILRSQLQDEGVAFDGDNIANYNAMLEAAENQINTLINQYNALSAAEQEAWDKAAKDGNDPIKQAEKYYEELKKQMDKYTDYMSTVYSEAEAMQDA